MVESASVKEKLDFSFLSFRIWGLCIFQFLMRASINIFFVTSQTTFFTVAGVDKLPYVYTAMNVVYISLQFFSISKLKGASRDYLKYLTWVFLFFLFCRFILFSAESAAVTVFYLLLVMIFDLFFSQFFSHFVNDVFPLQEAKRYLPVITGFGSLSFIVSGFFIRLSLNIISLKTLAMAGTAVFSIGILILMAYPKSSRPDTAVEEPDKIEKEKSPAPSVFSFSSLGKLIIAITFLNMLGKYWMDFQYSRAITQNYPSPEELAGFIAIYSSITDSLVLISQLGFAGYFFKKAGIINSTRILPAIILPMCILTTLKTGFWWIIATQFLFTFLVKSFYNSSFTLLYSIFPSDQRMKLLGVNGLTASFGAMISGVSLILFQSYLGTSSAFVLLAIVFGIMLYLCTPLEKGYKQELERTIARNDASSGDLFQAILANKDQQLKQALLKDLIDRSSGEKRLLAISQITHLSAENGNELLLPLTKDHNEPKVQSLAARLLAKNFQGETIEKIQSLCSEFASFPRVLANFLEGLGETKNRSDIEELLEYHLQDPVPRVQAAALTSILQISICEDLIFKSLQTLKNLLKNKQNPESTIAALSAIEKTGLPIFIPEVLAAINSADEQIANAGIRISGKFPAPEILNGLQKLSESDTNSSIKNLAKLQKQKIELSLENDIASILDSLSKSERASIEGKFSGISGETISLLKELLKLENAGARATFCKLLTENNCEDFREYFKTVLHFILEEELNHSIEPDKFFATISSAIQRIQISDKNLTRLLENLWQKKALSEFRFILHWEILKYIQGKALGFYREKCGDLNPENKPIANIETDQRLDLLISFLSIDSENPEKVLEAIKALSKGDQFYISTGLEYLESSLPAGIPGIFVKILSVEKDKGNFLKEFQTSFSLTEKQLHELASKADRNGNHE